MNHFSIYVNTSQGQKDQKYCTKLWMQMQDMLKLAELD